MKRKASQTKSLMYGFYAIPVYRYKSIIYDDGTMATSSYGEICGTYEYATDMMAMWKKAARAKNGCAQSHQYFL